MLANIGRLFFNAGLGGNRKDAITNVATVGGTVLSAIIAALIKAGAIPTQYSELAYSLAALALIVVGLVSGKTMILKQLAARNYSNGLRLHG